MKQTVLILSCLAMVGLWSPAALAASPELKAPGPAGMDDTLPTDMPAIGEKPSANETGVADLADAAEKGDKGEKARKIELPLEKKAKVVEKRLYPKAMKHELGVFFAIDPLDSYVLGIVEGARYVFHPVEYLGIQVSGAAVQTFDKEDASYIKDNMNVRDSNFKNSEMRWFAGADLVFYPLYGKFALLGDVVLHYDTGINIGAAAVGVKGGDIYAAPDVGLVSNVYLTKWLSLRGDLTYYAVITKDPRNNPNTKGEKVKNNTALRNHLMLSVGLSFHLPVE